MLCARWVVVVVLALAAAMCHDADAVVETETGCVTVDALLPTWVELRVGAPHCPDTVETLYGP